MITIVQVYLFFPKATSALLEKPVFIPGDEMCRKQMQR